MKLIHVTEVLSPWCDFSMIKPDVLDYACERGTRIHNVISSMLRGQWIPKIEQDIQGYIQSLKLFQKNILKTVFTEKTFEDQTYGITGTLDWGGYLKDRPSDFTIIDWKSPLVVSPTWKGQLSAYQYLARDYKPKRIGSFQLDPKGGPGKMTWYKNSASIFDAFLCALTAYKFFSTKLGG